MSDISHFIKMLQSQDHNRRYEACEELRVWNSPLPQQALDALQVATNDLHPDVADAAQRALALHSAADNETSLVDNSQNGSNLTDIDLTPKAVKDAQATHKTVSLIYVFLTIFMLIINCGGLFFGMAVLGWQAIIDIVLIPCLIVAGCIYISKYFIDQNNIKLGNVILFSPPILVWLYLVKDTW
jgi:hypothetical protein